MPTCFLERHAAERGCFFAVCLSQLTLCVLDPVPCRSDGKRPRGPEEEDEHEDEHYEDEFEAALEDEPEDAPKAELEVITTTTTTSRSSGSTAAQQPQHSSSSASRTPAAQTLPSASAQQTAECSGSRTPRRQPCNFDAFATL